MFTNKNIFSRSGKGRTCPSETTRRYSFLRNNKQVMFFESGLCVVVGECTDSGIGVKSHRNEKFFVAKITAYPRRSERFYSCFGRHKFRTIRKAKEHGLDLLDAEINRESFTIPKRDQFHVAIKGSKWHAYRKAGRWYSGGSGSSRHSRKIAWGRSSSKKLAQSDADSWLNTLS